jgi:hypothetical protein
MSESAPNVNDGTAIAWTQWDARTIYYVAQVPGEDGADWGYVTDPKKAKRLSRYWQRRFAASCRRCGHPARFIP